MSNKRHRFVWPIVAASLSVVIFGFAGWLLFNRQYAVDQVTVWAYRPTDAIETIEARTDLTDRGTFFFYASQPELATADSFNQSCPRYEVGSPILGCYANGRIYIFDITNDRLDGIEEVTAAHEMLHAAWDRMGDDEKRHLGSLLRSAYQKRADDELVTRMDYYERTEPGQFENELHSILGTEVANLGPELERYYSQYFQDRSAVLALNEQYTRVFEELSDRSEELYDDLIDLEADITRGTAQYNADVTLLSADIEEFNARADNGSFASMEQFNQERAALVARTNQLEADRQTINRQISSYNKKYVEYQKVASQIEALNDSIDSIETLQPTPSL